MRWRRAALPRQRDPPLLPAAASVLLFLSLLALFAPFTFVHAATSTLPDGSYCTYDELATVPQCECLDPAFVSCPCTFSDANGTSTTGACQNQPQGSVCRTGQVSGSACETGCSGASLDSEVNTRVGLGNCPSMSDMAVSRTNCSLACQPGYTCEACDGLRMCTDSVWSGTAVPACKATCPVSAVAGTTMGNCTSTINGFPSSCTLQLVPGRVLTSGSLTLTCNDGSLSSYPTTAPAPCTGNSLAAAVPLPANGIVGTCPAGSATLASGSMCQYKCASGSGCKANCTGNTASCNSGSWTQLNPVPTCVTTCAGANLTWASGRVTNGSCPAPGGTLFMGESCSLACTSGYVCSSCGGQRTCSNGGTWTGISEPTCYRPCSVVAPAGTTIGNCSTLNGFPSTCTLQLMPGYALANGSLTLTCTDGTLSAYPTTTISPCSGTSLQSLLYLAAPRSAGSCPVGSATLPSNSSCSYGCVTGYSCTGNCGLLASCSAGVWTQLSPQPTCTQACSGATLATANAFGVSRNDCPNATEWLPSFTFCNLRCLPGLASVSGGSDSIMSQQCISGGQWSGMAPGCYRKCVLPLTPAVVGANYTSTCMANSTLVHSRSCTLQVNSRYEAVGAASVRCNNGTLAWPTIIPAPCGSLPLLSPPTAPGNCSLLPNPVSSGTYCSLGCAAYSECVGYGCGSASCDRREWTVSPGLCTPNYHPTVTVSWAPNTLLRGQVSTFTPTVVEQPGRPIPPDAIRSHEWTLRHLTDTDQYTSTATQLVIPAYWLQAYKSYRLDYVLSLRQPAAAGLPTVQVFFNTTMITDASQPIVAISGADRSRPSDGPITIALERAYDPDVANSATTSSSVTLTWSCTEFVTAGVGAPCPLPSGTSLTQPSLLVPSNALTAGKVYVIGVSAVAISSGRQSAAAILLTATQPTTVTATLVSPPPAINADESLRLTAAVVCTSLPLGHPLLFQWQVEEAGGLVARTKPLPSLVDPSNLGAPANSSTLVLVPWLLQEGIQYRFSLTVRDPYSVDPATGTLRQTVAATTLFVNLPPVDGTCELAPASGGVSLTTQFTMTCSGWQDGNSAVMPLRRLLASDPSDPTLTFSFSYQEASGSGPTADGWQPLTVYSSSPAATFLLPAGSLRVRASIRALAGTVSTFDVLATVSPPQSAVLTPLQYVHNVSVGLLADEVNTKLCMEPLSLTQQLADILGKACADPQYSDQTSQTECARLADVLTAAAVAAWANCKEQAAAASTLVAQPVIALTVQTLLSLVTQPTPLLPSALTNLTSLTGDALSAAVAAEQPLSASSFDAFSSVVSGLMTTCSQLDVVTRLAHSLLHAQQAHAVAGEQLSFNRPQLVAYVQRSLVSEGSKVTLPNGQTVTFSAESLRRYAESLGHLTPADLDNGGADRLSLEMDTRVVTFASRWSNCRAERAFSVISSIELTKPTGEPIDLSMFGGEVKFELPFPCADIPVEPLCPGDPPRDPNSTSTSFDGAHLLTCSFFNVTTQSYSTDGCIATGISQIVNDGQCALTCVCNHLTEFAILRAEHDAANSACPSAGSLGSLHYLIFLVIYVAVGLVSSVQLMRLFRWLSWRKQWLAMTQYSLITAVCFFRALNHAVYYTLYQDLSFTVQTVISGLPYLFVSWIFTLVILAWGSIYAAAAYGKKAVSPFERFLVPFVLGNTLLSLALFAIFVAMGLTSTKEDSNDILVKLNQAGVLITSGVQLGLAVFFIIVGLMLVRALMNTISHKQFAKKLGMIAVALSLSFALSSALLLFSVVDEASFDASLLRNISAYFGLDLVGLLIVQGIFAKSLNDAIRTAQESKGAASSSKFGTNHGSSRNPHAEKSSTRHTTTSAVRRSVAMDPHENDTVELQLNPVQSNMRSDEVDGVSRTPFTLKSAASISRMCPTPSGTGSVVPMPLMAPKRPLQARSPLSSPRPAPLPRQSHPQPPPPPPPPSDSADTELEQVDVQVMDDAPAPPQAQSAAATSYEDEDEFHAEE